MNLSRELLHQLGGVTGFGWTASVIGYLSAALGYGGGYISRFAADSQSFLYAGVVLFLATFGLDRLAKSQEEDE